MEGLARPSQPCRLLFDLIGLIPSKPQAASRLNQKSRYRGRGIPVFLLAFSRIGHDE